MKKCIYCGRENDEGAIYCHDCGTTDFKSVTVAPAKSEPKEASYQIPAIAEQFRRVLSVGGFAVLSGFCGVGATWIVVALFTKDVLKNDASNKLETVILPRLVIGGVLGFIVGLVAALLVVKAGLKTQGKIERKFIGPTDRLRIYFGAPLFVIAVSSVFFERLLHMVGVGTGAYVGLGIALAIIAVSLFLYDRISKRFIIPVGIIGWLLTVVLVVGLFFFKQSAFGHH